MNRQELRAFLTANDIRVHDISQLTNRGWVTVHVIDTRKARRFLVDYQKKVGTEHIQGSAMTCDYVGKHRVDLLVFVHKIETNTDLP